MPFEVKAVSEDGEFEGLGSVFGNVDLKGDVVLPGAFERTIREKGDRRPALWYHNPAEPVGLVKIKEDEIGLRVKGSLNLEVQKARELRALLKQKAISGLSIGYDIYDGGYEFREDVRALKDIDLWEVSLVTFAANPAAVVTGVKRGERDPADAGEKAILEFARKAGDTLEGVIRDARMKKMMTSVGTLTGNGGQE